jgi:protein-tyrosine phosphatase
MEPSPSGKKWRILLTFNLLNQILFHFYWTKMLGSSFEEARKKLKKVEEKDIHIVESFSEIDDQPVEVFPNLFIGSIHCANNSENLLNLKINNILTLSYEEQPKHVENINYFEELVKDAHTFDITSIFPKCFEIIDSVRKKNEKILVHCMLGISRSGSVCIGYVMKEEKKPFVETWRKLKEKRSLIHPNEYFKKRLVEWSRKELEL